MDELFMLAIVGFLLFLVLLPFGLLIWLVRVSRRTRELEAELDALRRDRDALRRDLSRLHLRIDQITAAPPVVFTPPRQVDLKPPLRVASTTEPPPVPQAPLVIHPPEPVPAAPRKANLSKPAAPPPQPVIQESHPAPALPPIEAQAPPPRPLQALIAFDLEEALGTNWLPKIGMAILVVGISLFLAYTIQKLGPWGKVSVGILLSAAAIIGGALTERRKGWQIFGRVMLSGGWGLAYFTAYAMRNIDAARVLESDTAGLVVMLLVAAGMVGHSLKYHSQFVTGFAYGLAYLTLIINHVQWSTVVAAAVLAVSVVIVVRALDWYYLESFAILATYGSHLFWLYPIVNPMGSHKTPFPEYPASAAMLAGYWVIFTISHFLRRGKTDSDRRFLSVALLLNTFSYVGVSGYQSVHPDLAFSFFAVLGAVYFGLALLSRRLQRRESYLLTSTIGAVLIVIAVPYRYGGYSLALIWLAELEMFFITGFRLGEIHFRRLAWLASLVLVGYLLWLIAPSAGQPNAAHSVQQGILLLVTGIAFQANCLVLGRAYRSQIKSDFEDLVLTMYLYVGGGSILACAWVLVNVQWLVLAWLALALIYFELFRGYRDLHLCRLAHLTVALSIGRALVINLTYLFENRAWNRPAAIAVAAIILTYLYSENFRRWPSKTGEEGTSLLTNSLFDNYSYCAWTMALAVSWLILPSVWWGVVLGIGGCLLHGAGSGLKERRFLLQGQLTILIAVVRVIVVNLPAAGLLFGKSQRVVTGLTVAALTYAYGEFARRRPVWENEKGSRQHWLNAPAATLILTLLAWYSLSLSGVALAWGLLALALFELGRALKRADFLFQSHALAIATFVRLLLANLNATTQFGFVSARLVTILPLAAFFYYLFSLYRGSHSLLFVPSRERYAGWYSYFGLISLMAVTRFEVAAPWVAAVWTIIAIALVVASFRGGFDSFRQQAVWVTLLILARCIFENFYLKDKIGWTSMRIASTSLVIALLLAGFAVAWRLPKFAETVRNLKRPWWGRRFFQECVENVHHFYFFSAVGLATVLIWLETTGGGYLTTGWAIEAFVVFLMALLVNERAYRLFGVSLLLFCSGKIVFLDVWKLETVQRIITFIVLGAALVVVSFFYTRYRESWRKLFLGS